MQRRLQHFVQDRNVAKVKCVDSDLNFYVGTKTGWDRQESARVSCKVVGCLEHAAIAGEKAPEATLVDLNSHIKKESQWVRGEE